jgi:hypothetical protein
MQEVTINLGADKRVVCYYEPGRLTTHPNSSFHLADHISDERVPPDIIVKGLQKGGVTILFSLPTAELANIVTAPVKLKKNSDGTFDICQLDGGRPVRWISNLISVNVNTKAYAHHILELLSVPSANPKVILANLPKRLV